MRRLRCGMDNKVELILHKYLLQPFMVPDINRIMRVCIIGFLQFFSLPFGTCLVSEKIRTHIVVDTDNRKPFLYKKFDRLGPDKSRRTGNKNCFHKFTSFTANSWFDHFGKK